MEEKNKDSVSRQNHYYHQSDVFVPVAAVDNSEDTHFAEYPKTPKTLNGLIVFVILLCFVTLISVLSIATMLIYDGTEQDALGSANTTTTNQSSTSTTRPYDETLPELVVSPWPEGEPYTATEISEKVAPSIVSLVVYQNGTVKASGSGVVMTEDGYIITCAHIVDDEGDSLHYRVRLYDNSEYDARVIGYDSKTDIAVIKIDAKGLASAEFASSDNLLSGQDIFAIGTPGGFEFAGSITDGIISSPNRYISKSDGSYYRVIQHTAAINPGNSGGALVNTYGQVVGINSRKIIATEYEGMGFATSVSNVKLVIDDIIQYGAVVRRGRVGATYWVFDYLSEYAIVVSENNLPVGSVVMESIESISDLANYDVRSGDYLIGVNGKEMTSIEVLYDAMYSVAVGDSVTLEFFRPDTKQTFEVTCKYISGN